MPKPIKLQLPKIPTQALLIDQEGSNDVIGDKEQVGQASSSLIINLIKCKAIKK